jgi:hypothetical protein
MRRGVDLLSWIARAGMLCLLAAFCARVTIADGYMPELDRSTGEITVAICSGDGTQHTTRISIPVEAPRPKAQTKTCSYSAATMAALLPAPDPIARAAEAYVFAEALVAQPDAPPARYWSASAPPTGPPSLI